MQLIIHALLSVSPASCLYLELCNVIDLSLNWMLYHICERADIENTPGALQAAIDSSSIFLIACVTIEGPITMPSNDHAP